MSRKLVEKSERPIFGNVVIQNNSYRWHIGLSPAELNFSPRLKTALPTLGTSGCFNKKDYHKTVANRWNRQNLAIILLCSTKNRGNLLL